MDHATAATGAPVTVRYWAAAKAAAGCESELVSIVDPITLTRLRQLLAERHGSAEDGFDRVLRASSLLVGDRPVSPSAEADWLLVGGESVEVLPPFAGG